MHSESCLLSKHNIWECKLVWVPAYYTHWFLPSAYQLAWVLYLKSSRFDPRYVVYDNCRHSMCVCVCVSFSFSVLLFIKAKQSPWRISQECRRMIPLHHLLPISAKTVRGKQWVRIGLHLNETGGAELWTEDQHHPSFYVEEKKFFGGGLNINHLFSCTFKFYAKQILKSCLQCNFYAKKEVISPPDWSGCRVTASLHDKVWGWEENRQKWGAGGGWKGCNMKGARSFSCLRFQFFRPTMHAFRPRSQQAGA